MSDRVLLMPGEAAMAVFRIDVVLANDPDIDGEWDERLVPTGEAIGEAVEEWLAREVRPWTARTLSARLMPTDE
jgi:hypothetical protein